MSSARAPARTGAPTDSAATDALKATWRSYAGAFIQGGRVVDPRSNNDTTSEGQSYAMLRAAWMSDRSTFDSVWQWTRDHLWDPGAHRFGWHWGATAGSLLSHDSASDADEDIALALLFAAHRWSDSSYTDWARRVLDGIWQNDVASLNGTPYLVAGNWAGSNAAGLVLNPSYFAPYAYRVFAQADSAHPWLSLVGSSYSALNACSQAALQAPQSAGLPPNWCVLSSGGRAGSFTEKSDGDDYGYDAFRVMWRVALDLQWSGSSAARAYLTTQQFLRSQWQQHGTLSPIYGHDGSVRANYDDVTVAGGDIGAFITDPAATGAVAAHLMSSLTTAGSSAYWAQSDNYYAQNWVWFGIALANGTLVNMATQ
ncbi:MAG: hypothetical protein JOZ46_04330 [Candidatus Dormibacteraeota bacterium]|nr:hypothetical protein [Candidatus Dormibacteraeota bacterium]MBV9525027.1 hypothetical protein [Candidatus Dormibacteraeota bacterium]